MTQVRSYNRSVDINSMPDHIRRLHISPEGFPVPWFVVWFKDGQPCEDGEGLPDFRITDPHKIVRAVKQRRCWICGEGPLGVNLSWCIGPMCAINKVISEPHAHRSCCIWSAKNCPFLARPKMKRHDADLRDESGNLLGGLQDAPGFGLRRNPGAVCVWTTKSFKVFNPQHGQPGVLFNLGPPVETLWFANGRAATREEVMESIDSGYPTLVEMAKKDGGNSLAALAKQREIALKLVPAQ